ncbi:SAM-dependent methyltransferase [Actinomycetospora soli]|uniref:SAM-dependent methyltransferase n=1 Tax=Actinomycetospora soli TaxID=2893887 RepID=UPI001E2D867B|nr:SAM-dependent methyltransferase [Actinomycetospora soli]MCD2190252.1 SAM-dependent methyltransferase [Actinomycetospora soli]
MQDVCSAAVPDGPDEVDEVDDQRPVVARVHDYIVGGSHHRLVDREFAHELVATVPGIDEVIRELLAFRPRVVAHLAARGVDQYLDLGAGLPTVRPTHEVAAAAGLRPRVVYVDNDPDAVAPARELLDGHDGVRVVEGDVGEPGTWWPAVAAHLDLARPVAVIASAVLHYVDDDAAAATMRTVRESTVPGSTVAIAALSGGGRPEPRMWTDHRHGGLSYPPRLREPGDMADWLRGYDVVGPGWVAATHWAADVDHAPTPADAGSAYWGVVARRR